MTDILVHRANFVYEHEYKESTMGKWKQILTSCFYKLEMLKMCGKTLEA